jgi:outer membrane protein TolC
LIGYEKLHQVRIRQEDTVADLRESFRLSNMRYTGGTTTHLEFLDGQRALLAAELALAEEATTKVSSSVTERSAGAGKSNNRGGPFHLSATSSPTATPNVIFS